MFKPLAVFAALNIVFVWGVAIIAITLPRLNDNPRFEAYDMHQASYLSAETSLQNHPVWQ